MKGDYTVGGVVFGDGFACSVAADTLDVPFDLARAVPENWERHDVYRCSGAGLFVANPAADHVAIIVGPHTLLKEAKSFYFGTNGPLWGPFILCWWDSKTDKYVGIHCLDCSYATLSWFVSKQADWRPHDAPQALQ